MVGDGVNRWTRRPWAGEGCRSRARGQDWSGPGERALAALTATGGTEALDAQSWGRVVALEAELPALPAHMFAHRLLEAEEERLLAVHIRAGQEARTQLDAGEVSRSLALVAERGQRARNVLVSFNLRLAADEARHAPPALDFEDRLAFAMLGLIRAADGFDPERGRFSTYAVWWIRQHLSRGSDDEASLVRVPVHQRAVLRSLERESESMGQRFGVAGTELLTCCFTGVRHSELGEAAVAFGRVADGVIGVAGKERGTVRRAWLASLPVHSLEQMDEAWGEHWPVRVDPLTSGAGDGAVDGRTPSQRCVDSMVEGLRSGEIAGIVWDRDAAMLALRLGMEDGEEHTLDDIGARFGITRERVRQIVNKVLADEDFRSWAALHLDHPSVHGLDLDEELAMREAIARRNLGIPRESAAAPVRKARGRRREKGGARVEEAAPGRAERSESGVDTRSRGVLRGARGKAVPARAPLGPGPHVASRGDCRSRRG